jgi:hypothetical protein
MNIESRIFRSTASLRIRLDPRHRAHAGVEVKLPAVAGLDQQVSQAHGLVHEAAFGYGHSGCGFCY